MATGCQFCCLELPMANMPYVYHNNVLGPSIDEVILSLLFILALKSCEALGIAHKPGMKGYPDSQKNDVDTWLSKEVKDLAVELSLVGYDISEPGMCSQPTPSMLQARKFVLNKLAELMEKKDDLERCICRRVGS